MYSICFFFIVGYYINILIILPILSTNKPCAARQVAYDVGEAKEGLENEL